MSPEERIKLAIEFTKQNLEQVFRRQEARADLQRKLYAVMRIGLGVEPEPVRQTGFYAMPTTNIDDMVLDDCLTLQKDTRALLVALSSPAGWCEADVSVKYGVSALPGLKLHIRTIRGAFRDVFLVSLWHLLNSPAGECVAQCPEQNCGHKLFFRPTKRAMYCSPTCSTRARVRRMRYGKGVGINEVELSVKSGDKRGKPKKK